MFFYIPYIYMMNFKKIFKRNKCLILILGFVAVVYFLKYFRYIEGIDEAATVESELEAERARRQKDDEAIDKWGGGSSSGSAADCAAFCGTGRQCTTQCQKWGCSNCPSTTTDKSNQNAVPEKNFKQKANRLLTQMGELLQQKIE